jgi:hypothetical protein
MRSIILLDCRLVYILERRGIASVMIVMHVSILSGRPKPADKHPQGQPTSRKVARAGYVVGSTTRTWVTLLRPRNIDDRPLLSSLPISGVITGVETKTDLTLNHTLRFCGTGGAPRATLISKRGILPVRDEVKNRGLHLRIGQVLHVQ